MPAQPILVVEDNRDTAELEAHLIQGIGCDAVIAETVSAARLMVESSRVSGTGLCVIVLDVLLPDGNGIEFLRWFRSFDRSTPVLVYAASERFRDDALAAGAHAFLSKAGDIDELEQTIRTLISNE